MTVTDANHCTSSINYTLNPYPPASVTIVGPDSLCADHFATLSTRIDRGDGPFTFLWNNGATTSSIQNVGVGEYQLRITDIHSCTSNFAYEIQEIAPVNCINSTTDHDNLSSIQVYPNPFSNSVQIFNHTGGLLILELYTITGQTITTQSLSIGASVLHLDDLKGGFYIAVFKDEKGQYMKVEKWTKTK